MEFFLGIDAGGTGTRALVVDASGMVLGRGEAGPGNYHNIGLDNAVENICRAASQALEAADTKAEFIAAAFAGCAGVKSRSDIHQVGTALHAGGLAPSGLIAVKNDLYNALAGGLAGDPGIALIAGTGSNCLGCDALGAEWMCGGWGWLLDAPGSAFGLTLASILEVTREADARSTRGHLYKAILDFLEIKDPDEIPQVLYVRNLGTDELAAFAPTLIRCAQEGDTAALEILQEGASALAELVATTATRLRFEEGPQVVLLGGCVRSGHPYQRMVEDAIDEACPVARIVEPRGTPLQGAAANALRLLGIKPPPDFFEL